MRAALAVLITGFIRAAILLGGFRLLGLTWTQTLGGMLVVGTMVRK